MGIEAETTSTGGPRPNDCATAREIQDNIVDRPRVYKTNMKLSRQKREVFKQRDYFFSLSSDSN